MKNTQKIIFIVVLLIACFSAYSLADMNQVHKVDFSWNNGKVFVSDKRPFFEQYYGTSYPQYMDFDIITSQKEIISISGTDTIKRIECPKFDNENEFLVFATLGEIRNGHSIKIKDIAERGNIIEVLIDMGQPRLIDLIPYGKSYPYDIIKVPKDNLEVKDGLLFIFKDYRGNELFKKNFSIDKKDNFS